MTLTEKEAIFVGLGKKRRMQLKRDERLKKQIRLSQLAKLRKFKLQHQQEKTQ